jgi:carboxypeptidase PM20D1
MGSQDVVPADPAGWEHAPFSGDIANGNVHGRGAMDCKCTVMSEMAAVEELLEEGFTPERDVYLAYACNEETSGGGALKLVNYLKDKGIRLCAAMDEGGAIVEGVLPGMSTLCAAVGVIEKGTSHIKFTAKSAGGHSSTPPRNTPFARLSAFVCEMEKKNHFKTKMPPVVEKTFTCIAPYLTFPMRFLFGNLWLFKPLITALMPVFSPQARAFVTTTLVFTMSEGSKAPNVIPSEASMTANMRVGQLQSRDECLEILRKTAAKYDIETELIIGFDSSKETDTESDEMLYLKKCVNEVFPQYCFAPYYMSGGTDCRHYTAITDNCIRFTPIVMDSQQLAAMHAPNENIGTAAVAAGVKFYKYFIKNHN